MMPIQRFPTPLPMPFSKVVRAGGFLFLSGVLPMDGDGKLSPAPSTCRHASSSSASPRRSASRAQASATSCA